MKQILRAAACLLMSVLYIGVYAQRDRVQNYYTIQITPDHTDWEYRTGEDVVFTVAVMRDTYPQPGVEIEWEWSEDMLEPTAKGVLNTGKGYATLKLKGMNRPGFMRLSGKLKVDGTVYSNYTTVGFGLDKLEPTAQLPSDFMTFWRSVLDKSAKVPLEPLMTLQPDLCTPWADVYHVRFQNAAAGRYIYGMLSVPKGDGPFPAVLRVPGAGVRAYKGATEYAREGVVSLEIGIHGIPVNLPDQIYSDLRANALSNYNTSHNDSRDDYYYKDVYSGCVKAVDFLCSLPQVDAARLGVCGGSQGGALAIVTAALDDRIKYLYADYPALCEIAGFYHGRTGGWPKIFRNRNEPSLEVKVKVSEYYDVVNFARHLTIPILFGMSFNDMVCPPTSTRAAYNVIRSEKRLFQVNDAGHWRYPEQYDYERDWLIEQLKK